MSRITVAIDRAIAFLLSLALIAGGAGLGGWGTRQVPGLDGTADLAPLQDAADKSWWPWAVGAAGIVLIVLGLRWLAVHIPSRRVSRVRLPGSDRSGRLTAEARPVAVAAAAALAAQPGVRSTRGSVFRDRGQTVVRLVAVVDPAADLADVAAGADRVSADMRRMLGRDDLRCRVQLKISRTATRLSRVS